MSSRRQMMEEIATCSCGPVTWSINTNQLDSITSQRKGPECYLPTLGDATGSALSLLLDTFRTFRLDNSPMVSGRDIKELAAR